MPGVDDPDGGHDATEPWDANVANIERVNELFGRHRLLRWLTGFLNWGYVPGPPLGRVPARESPFGGRSRVIGWPIHRRQVGLLATSLWSIPVRGRRVLEVGAGRGGNSRLLARHGRAASVVGLDLVTAGLADAAGFPGAGAVGWTTGDAQALPLRSACMDVVVTVESRHGYRSQTAFVAEAARVLAAGGHLVMSDAFAAGEVAPLVDLVKQAGFVEPSVLDLSDGVLRSRRRGRSLQLRLRRTEMSPGAADFSCAPGSRVYRAMQAGELRFLAIRARRDRRPVGDDLPELAGPGDLLAQVGSVRFGQS
ncbi:MAG: class I SAM-dependent methyltransferase [Microthrixaceae bacterium]